MWASCTRTGDFIIKGTGNREQGIGKRQKATGNREQGTGNREKAKGKRQQATVRPASTLEAGRNRQQEIGKRQKEGTANSST
ncbi:MAG: hypothetical protein AB4426_03705 [Xenococcaceae cyanobacterium]